MLFIYSTGISGQEKTERNHQPLSLKHAGNYAYGSNAEKEKVGSISLFAETDTTMLFYIDLNAGAPSYSMGSLYGRVKTKNNFGVFYRLNSSAGGCKLLFTFSDDEVIIETIDAQFSCGFGHGVSADGKFKKISKNQPDHFIDQEAQTIYFSKTKPEDYEK